MTSVINKRRCCQKWRRDESANFCYTDKSCGVSLILFDLTVWRRGWHWLVSIFTVGAIVFGIDEKDQTDTSKHGEKHDEQKQDNLNNGSHGRNDRLNNIQFNSDNLSFLAELTIQTEWRVQGTRYIITSQFIASVEHVENGLVFINGLHSIICVGIGHLQFWPTSCVVNTHVYIRICGTKTIATFQCCNSSGIKLGERGISFSQSFNLLGQ